jgi:predicted Zn finger-like uncharacterized protein
MIKVECVSCKAPYELDPRRIPDKGMKMRCPKCGSSFSVSKEGVASAAAPAGAPPPIAPPPAAGGAKPPAVGAPPPLAPPPAIAAPFSPKSTMLGHTAAQSPEPPPKPAGVNKLKTAIGVAPPSPPEAAPAGALLPPPGAGPGVPFKAPLAPAFVPPPPIAGSRTAAAKGAFGATMLGAGPTPGKRVAVAPEVEIDLPALRNEDEPIGGVEMPDDLPALKPPIEAQDLSVSRIYVEDLPVPTGEVDLPAPRVAADKPVQVQPETTDADDLPALKARTKGQAAPPAGFDAFGDLDLPARRLPVSQSPAAPKVAGGGFGDLDLPAPKGLADLPAPRGVADLPAVRGVADLPAVRGVADLPATKSGADLPAPKGGTDLPAPRGQADLPAFKSGADLPIPKADMDLPSRKGGGGMSFGDLDLPAPKADGGFGDLDLPAPQDNLPVRRADESSFADVDLALPDLPDTADESSGGQDAFGDIQLPPPKAAANLVPPKAKTVQGMGGRSAPVTDESSFGDLTLGDGDSDLPPSLMGDDESSFGDLSPESERPRPPPPRAPAPPRSSGRAGALDDVEELEPDPEPDELGDESFDEQDDDFGEAEFQEGEEEGAAEGSDEEMEFGISGEEGGRGMSLPPEVLRRQRGEEFEAKQAARGQRTITIVMRVAILLVLLGAGGAALTFTSYGVFGIYYWEHLLPEAGDPQFARSAIEKAEKIAASDTYVDARRSLKELGDARGKAGLNRELLTRSLLHHALFIVRFGEDPNVAAHAAAISKRLEERSWKAPGMDLARAADAARRKQWADVDTAVAAALAQGPTDPYPQLIAGEAALARGKLDAAEKSFGKALQLGGGTRAQWGLARVALQRTDFEAQNAAVNETLKLSPMHVDARMAEARILWTQGKEERAQHSLRVALGLDPTEEDQYLSSSKLALSAGYALLGYIHESRGRLHVARESYEQALSADPYRVEALLGSGRVLLREKRYADAQARFESALSAATKGGENPTVLSGRKADAEAKLGIGRALIALQRGQEAQAKLDELNTALPNDPEVILALGETAQALGNNDLAETQFRRSIELAPKRFDGYLALAQFFFKKGDAGKASDVLNDAASHVEETAEMRRMLGQSELARSRLDSAIHEFQRALELDPHDVDAMFGMGVALRKRGDLDQAQKTLEEIAKRDAAYAGLAEQNGLLFEARGDFVKAVGAYTTALEKDPGDSALLLRLGAAQVASSQFDAAEQTLAKVIHELPNSAEAEYFIGRIAFARGRTPDALTHFDRAVGLDGTKGEYHLYVARASLEMGNLGRTLEEIQSALAHDPSLGDAYWVRAVVRLRMGAVKDALSDLNKALKLNPARNDAYAVQGDCYEQLRQMPEALHAYRTALEKEPARGEWWYRLAILQADSGDHAGSETSAKRALEIGDKVDPMPYWLPDTHRLSGENAEARGDRTAAIRQYKRYIEIANAAAIDHTEIERKLKGWGVQLQEDE